MFKKVTFKREKFAFIANASNISMSKFYTSFESIHIHWDVLPVIGRPQTKNHRFGLQALYSAQSSVLFEMCWVNKGWVIAAWVAKTNLGPFQWPTTLISTKLISRHVGKGVDRDQRGIVKIMKTFDFQTIGPMHSRSLMKKLVTRIKKLSVKFCHLQNAWSKVILVGLSVKK